MLFPTAAASIYIPTCSFFKKKKALNLCLRSRRAHRAVRTHLLLAVPGLPLLHTGFLL